MSALFCFDARFFFDESGTVWLPKSELTNVIWARYLQHFDKVVFAGRGLPLSTLANQNEREELCRLPVSCVVLPNIWGVGALTHRAEAISLLRAAIGQADAVIARIPSEVGLLGAKLAHEAARPCAIEFVSDVWSAYWHYGTWAGKVYAPLATWRASSAARRADFAVYVSKALQRRFPNQNASAVFSNVDLAEPTADVLAARLERIERRRPPLILGLIGNYHHRIKGLHIAIEAMASLQEHSLGAELHIVGSGDPTPLMALAERSGLHGRVFFPGRLPGGEPVLRWLDGVDIYLQPSFAEGLPRALIESMSRGCTCLASAVDGPLEILEPECLHRAGNATKLASLILRATAEPEWRKAQARRNFQAAKAYTNEVLDQQRMSFWRAFATFASTDDPIARQKIRSDLRQSVGGAADLQDSRRR